MAFEQINNLKSYKKTSAAKTVQSTQNKIELEDAKKVLSVATTAVVTKYEVDAETLTAFVSARTNVIYENNDGIIKNTQKDFDFNFSQSLPVGEQFSFLVNEKETTIEQIETNNYITTTKFEIETFVLVQTEFCAIKPGSEGVFEKTKQISVQTLCATCADKFAVSSEAEITATSVLFSDAKCTITSTTATDDAIVVDGELMVCVLTEIDGNIKQTYKKIDFSGEVVALGLKKDNSVVAKAQVENLSVSLSNAGANATLAIGATIAVSAECFAQSSVDVVEDAFSETKDLLVSSQGIEINHITKSFYTKQEIGAVLQTKDKNVNMGTILAVLSPKYESETVSCQVIYREAETDQIASTIMLANIENADDGSEMIVKSFAKKRSKEVMVELEAISNEINEQNTFEVFASQIEEGAESEEDNKGIIVYSAKKDQDLFSVAKSLKANPQLLKEQNPDLFDIMPEDRKIIYYRSQQIKF